MHRWLRKPALRQFCEPAAAFSAAVASHSISPWPGCDGLQIRNVTATMISSNHAEQLEAAFHAQQEWFVSIGGTMRRRAFMLNGPGPTLLGRFRLNGFGIGANLTAIDQRASGGAFSSSNSTPAVALGVAPHTYNGTVYYDNSIVSARLSGTFAKGSQTAVTNQNSIPDAALFSDDYKQWDFSGSVDLSKLFSWETDIQATLDVINIFEAKQRSYFQFENAAFTQYDPGRQYLVGIRGRF